MENDKRRAMFKSKDMLAMIARPSETPLTAKSLNAVSAFYNSCIARLVPLCLVEGRENLGGVPFRIPNVHSMRFVGSKPWGDLDSPMFNQGADVEGCGHGAKSALHLLPSQILSKLCKHCHLIRTASKGNAVEANHHRLRRGQREVYEMGRGCEC